MEDDDSKTRRFNLETEEGESIPNESMSPASEPDPKFQKLDEEMLDSMTEIDRKILAAAILGVDITEVYSPERVAKVAQRFGLKAGSSFDLTNGWDFNIEDPVPFGRVATMHLLLDATGVERSSPRPQARADQEVRRRKEESQNPC